MTRIAVGDGWFVELHQYSGATLPTVSAAYSAESPADFAENATSTARAALVYAPLDSTAGISTLSNDLYRRGIPTVGLYTTSTESGAGGADHTLRTVVIAAEHSPPASVHNTFTELRQLDNRSECDAPDTPYISQKKLRSHDTPQDMPTLSDTHVRSMLLSRFHEAWWYPHWQFYEQFDRYVQGNTVMSFADEASLIRLDEISGRGVAIALGSREDACARVSATGAHLLGYIPLHDIPCEAPSPHTPDTPGVLSKLVLALGEMDTVFRRIPSGFSLPGQTIYILGGSYTLLAADRQTRPEHQQSLYAGLADILLHASRDGMVDAARAVTSGGLGIALAQACTRFGTGARVTLDELSDRLGMSAADIVLSAPSIRSGAILGPCAVVAVPRSEEVRFTDMCHARGFPHMRIGMTDTGSTSPSPQAGFGTPAGLNTQTRFKTPSPGTRAKHPGSEVYLEFLDQFRISLAELLLGSSAEPSTS